ncbi:MAG: putative signaling protein [uncultured marine phage]|uniref:Putative signaling protein n=1 Tax=uncultured marine phage TaxID=707152 RepID=A0A8D9FRQ6_9VIRU|nr:MAG: putative signaling protein [uncultured marine phage]
MRNYNLLIDDNRTIKNVVEVSGNTMYFETDWVIVRTFDQFCDAIKRLGVPEMVSFDHDIADFKDGDERSGHTCAKFLVDVCIDNDLDFPTYFIHSANPVGRDNIVGYVEDYINKREKGFFK